MNDPTTKNAKIEPIALTVLGGFLGSGKTTLINNVLRRPEARGAAVLVNDFGDVNIDARLITSRTFDTISLANGCICCSIGGNLTRALLDISRWPSRPEQLIIETSGVADPAKVAAYGRIGRSFSLHGVTVMVDAERIRAQHADPQLTDTINRQLSCAHLLVLNKCDRVQAIERAELAGWLQGRCPSARVVETQYADVPAELVLSQLFSGELTADPVMCSAEEKHLHSQQFVTWTYRDDRPFRRDALEQILADDNSLLRVKGMVTLADSPDKTFLLQLVGTYWTLRVIDPGEHDQQVGAELVLIGVQSRVATELLNARLASAH